MSSLDNPRTGNLAGAGICALLMGYALYAQHGLGLEPCPLCVFQRVAVAGLGLVFLLAALHGGRGLAARLWGVLLALVALAGMGVAGRHVWLQSLPPDQVPACGPGLDYMMEFLPLREVLALVLSGSGECAEVDWAFLGLSMPAWVFVALLVLGSAGLAWNWRAARASMLQG
ncbi:MAG: disulfide bond formation protein B [Chromatiales bacterium]|nr:disulfide bond formation protein B [Chromatiales bacterium]